MFPGAQNANSSIGHRSKSLSNPGSLSAAARREIKAVHQSIKSSESPEDAALSSEGANIFIDDGSLFIPPSARARERKLRQDPMANVLSPLYVSCKLCETKIKLSTKSMFDLCHWRTHRQRCLKRRPKGLSQLQASSSIKVRKPLEEQDEPTSSSAKVSPKAMPSKMKSLGAKAPATDSGDDADSSPETDDDNSVLHLRSPESSSNHSRASSPDKQASSPAPLSATDPAFEAYMAKSNRPTKQHPLENWQDWSWSQLTSPRFDYTPTMESEDAPHDQENDHPLSGPMLNAMF